MSVLEEVKQQTGGKLIKKSFLSIISFFKLQFNVQSVLGSFYLHVKTFQV